MSITDSGTPKKEEERIANIIVKSFNKKKVSVLFIIRETYYLKPD